MTTANVKENVDLFDLLGERTYSVLGSIIDLIGDKPLDIIEKIEMTIANFKVGKLTKKGAKGLLVSFLGNSATNIAEEFLDIDLSIINSVFDTIGDLSAIVLAFGIYRDTKTAWRTAVAMSPEEVIALRKEKVEVADNFIENFLS